MKLGTHVLLVTAISDVGLSTEKEPESHHIQRAKSLINWENIQTGMQLGRRSEAAASLIEAAAHLCHAADKILAHADKPGRERRD